MEPGERRIRRLRLAGSDAVFLPAARWQLEEAFRLAFLPGLPPNALVLIRNLDLGWIRADLPPWRLAKRIDDLVRELAAQAVCVDRQAAPAASVVWFSDPLHPFLALMTRLLDNGAATEWYWRAMFPERVFLLDDVSVERLLRGAAETPLKSLGQGLLVQHCLSLPGRERFFSLLTRPMIIRLLRDLGLLVAGLAGQGSKRAMRPGDGLYDAGSQSEAWPHRKETIRAPKLSLPWRSALQWAARIWGEGDERSLWLAYLGLLCHQPAWLVHSSVPQRIDMADWLRQWASGGPGGNSDPGYPADGGMGMATTGRRASARMKPAAVLPDEAPGRMVEPLEESSLAFNGEPGLAEGPGGEEKGGRVEQTLRQPPSRLAASPTAMESRLSPAAGPECGLTFSSHAGFALLIPLLIRLGMVELLAGHESLVELDFPGRLLSAFARRFGLAEDDPCRAFIDRPVPADHSVLDAFCAPSAWWRLAVESGRSLICLQTAQGGRSVIVAPGGRWLLGVGDAVAMMASHGLDSAAVFPGGMTKHPVRLDDALVSMQLAAAVYLRRRCALSLRTLVKRPGKVLLAATHWDVIFDLDQTDLRLRRVALDSDPGWVAWQGKVVRFHYQENTERIFHPSSRVQR